MKTLTINISFKPELLSQIDQIAEKESRSRSELIREAIRMYIQRKNKWDSIFEFSKKQVIKLNLKRSDIEKEIVRYRKSKRS